MSANNTLVKTTGRVIFWDFDRTLAYRPGGWAGVMAEALREHDPFTAITADDLRPLLDTGFPWHSPELPHPELRTPDLWWTRVEGVLARAFEGAGVSIEIARTLARRFRHKYTESESFVVFDEVVPVLGQLSRSGWRHVIVSNHVPELEAIVERIGLMQLVELVVNSASTGYEKPHPEMYRIALEVAGMPETRWMVGDNIDADVLGAENAGIKGILVRNTSSRARWNCPDLRGVIEIVEDSP